MPAFSWSGRAARLAGKVFGGACYLCRGASTCGVICAACCADLPHLPAARCPRCALPTADARTCGRCLATPPAYDATVAAFAYAFPADVLLQGLKFRGELALAPFVSDALCSAVRAVGEPESSVDLLLPVPLHPARLRQRGYNQSMEIARGVAQGLHVPVDFDLCFRARDTAAQLDLPRKAREKNVRDAFSCRRALEGAAVAVVDDVMTTGATLAELAATLKKFGARRVVNWVAARTTGD